MNSLLIAMMIVSPSACPTTKVVNTIEKNNRMTSDDVAAYNTALRRCGAIYGKSVCVKNFEIKLDPWGDRAYRITCIVPNEETLLPLIEMGTR